jgi:predicted 2-oxoglutarate/Fe(II)-dependent dioxygenase YbiX
MRRWRTAPTSARSFWFLEVNTPAPEVLKLPAVGAPAPRFFARTDVNERFSFDTLGGRYIVLGFLGSAGAAHAAGPIAAVSKHRQLFDDGNIALFWVTCDPGDKAEGRLADSLPGIRAFWDFDFEVSRLWGLAKTGEETSRYAPMWFLIDPQLRVLAFAPMTETDRMMTTLEQLPPVGRHGGMVVPAPVLVLPRVFEPEFCRTLIKAYQDGEAIDSGFMQQKDGKTVLVLNHLHKRRRDVNLEDEGLIAAARGRINARMVPEIERCFQFKPTRIERYIVACYDAADEAHFKPHRDNTTSGTAHRRFAVTINLNAEDYEGGDLVFPEFGPQTYRAPTGGAVIFSCSLLHEARPVTRGVRYAFLPFLYDDAAAKVREANLHLLDESLRNPS